MGTAVARLDLPTRQAINELTKLIALQQTLLGELQDTLEDVVERLEAVEAIVL